MLWFCGDCIQLCIRHMPNKRPPSLCPPGNKIMVRCLRLLKPYTKKGVTDDDDDEDDDEEDDPGARRRALPTEGRIMESDILSQAYNIGRFHHSSHCNYLKKTFSHVQITLWLILACVFLAVLQCCPVVQRESLRVVSGLRWTSVSWNLVWSVEGWRGKEW